MSEFLDRGLFEDGLEHGMQFACLGHRQWQCLSVRCNRKSLRHMIKKAESAKTERGGVKAPPQVKRPIEHVVLIIKENHCPGIFYEILGLN